MEKPKSFIPKPRTERIGNFNNQIRGTDRVGLRRSKSFSDISTVTRLGITKSTFLSLKPPLQEPSSSNSRRLLTEKLSANKVPGKSSSVTNLNAVSSTCSLKTTAVGCASVGTKRPIANIVPKTGAIKRVKPDTTNKDQKENGKATAKPIKPPKPASYDYKARFNLLNERHTTLRTVHNELKEKFTRVEDESSQLQEENALQTQRISELENDQVRLRILETEYKIAEVENEKFKRETETLTKELKALKDIQAILNEKHDTMSKRLELTEAKLEEKVSHLKCTLELLETCKEELNTNEAVRRDLHNTVQNLKGNIRVFCRVRPLLDGEAGKPLCNISYNDESTIELRNRENHKNEFMFDKVFPPESTQCDIFEDMAGLVQSALDGYHVCVFAYGQTGSGKTYTMQGELTDSALGMIPRSMDLLFNSINRLEKIGWEYTVEASFLEIYNETIRDLLDIQPKQHEIRYNEGKGVTVTNLKIQPIKSVEDFGQLMQTAWKYRAVAATNFNEHSSRSHAVTKIYINGVNKQFKISYTGSLNLIDLAGSESAKTSSDQRLLETKNINRSLSALGTVILALHNKDSFVSFRNSKLTYLLQSCLSGNSKTLMVVNVSPFDDCYNETINSLRFAFKVKSVKINSRKNKAYISTQEPL